VNKEIVVLLVRAFLISFVYPIGLVATGCVVGVLVGAFGFFVGGCKSFDVCFWSPFLDFLLTPKTWKLLLLMWGVGVVFVYWQVYRDLKDCFSD
jgi:ABC-type microcin C transport system permease subunit YejE